MASPSLPLIERINALDLSDFAAKYLPSSPTLHYKIATLPDYLTIVLQTSSTISSVDLSACFEIIRATSAASYEASSLGWHPHRKRKEMRLPDMRYLLVRSSETSPVQGFLSFMLTYEDGIEVIYVYEVHLTEEIQGSGLGAHLMELVEGVGTKAGMKKAMLTAFVENKGAVRFYQRRRYGIDEFSPKERKLRGGVIKKPDYVILSKMLR